MEQLRDKSRMVGWNILRRTWDAKIKIWNFAQAFEPGATCTEQGFGTVIWPPCAKWLAAEESEVWRCPKTYLNRSPGTRCGGPGEAGGWESRKRERDTKALYSAGPAWTRL